ncbi:unnamed protein product, partial [Heterotrigona itama]
GEYSTSTWRSYAVCHRLLTDLYHNGKQLHAVGNDNRPWLSGQTYDGQWHIQLRTSTPPNTTTAGTPPPVVTLSARGIPRLGERVARAEATEAGQLEL